MSTYEIKLGFIKKINHRKNLLFLKTNPNWKDHLSFHDGSYIFIHTSAYPRAVAIKKFQFIKPHQYALNWDSKQHHLLPHDFLHQEVTCLSDIIGDFQKNNPDIHLLLDHNFTVFFQDQLYGYVIASFFNNKHYVMRIKLWKNGKEILIPQVDDYVKLIDINQKYIYLKKTIEDFQIYD